jgi:hypothetical protein
LYSHDVSVFGGLRGGAEVGAFRVGGELLAGTRFNYLFQNRSYSFEPVGAVDLRTYTLRFTIEPRWKKLDGRVSSPQP